MTMSNLAAYEASIPVLGDNEKMDDESKKFIVNNDHDEEMTEPQKSPSSPPMPTTYSIITGNWKALSLILLLLSNLIVIKYSRVVAITTQETSVIVKKNAQSKLKEWKANIPTLLSKLSPTELPSYNQPFIFFHGRKSGGSSMRKHIHHEAKRNNIEDAWIPCETCSCVPYSLPPPTNKTITIFAAHLNFMHMTQIMRETRSQQSLMSSTMMKQPITLDDGTNVNYHKLDDSYPLFDCVTFIRPTVDRVVSCWNYRMDTMMSNPLYKMPRSNELTPQDWDNLLPYAMDKHNNGCNNEYARIFGSTVHESQVNALSPTKPSFLEELDNIASRISKCVILHIDRCEESDVILRHYVPWMSGASFCSQHQNEHGVDSDAVSEEAAAVILEQNQMDELIYEFANDIFEQQLDIASQN